MSMSTRVVKPSNTVLFDVKKFRDEKAEDKLSSQATYFRKLYNEEPVYGTSDDKVKSQYDALFKAMDSKLIELFGNESKEVKAFTAFKKNSMDSRLDQTDIQLVFTKGKHYLENLVYSLDNCGFAKEYKIAALKEPISAIDACVSGAIMNLQLASAKFVYKRSELLKPLWLDTHRGYAISYLKRALPSMTASNEAHETHALINYIHDLFLLDQVVDSHAGLTAALLDEKVSDKIRKEYKDLILNPLIVKTLHRQMMTNINNYFLKMHSCIFDNETTELFINQLNFMGFPTVQEDFSNYIIPLNYTSHLLSTVEECESAMPAPGHIYFFIKDNHLLYAMLNYEGKPITDQIPIAAIIKETETLNISEKLAKILSIIKEKYPIRTCSPKSNIEMQLEHSLYDRMRQSGLIVEDHLHQVVSSSPRKSCGVKYVDEKTGGKLDDLDSNTYYFIKTRPVEFLTTHTIPTKQLLNAYFKDKPAGYAYIKFKGNVYFVSHDEISLSVILLDSQAIKKLNLDQIETHDHDTKEFTSHKLSEHIYDQLDGIAKQKTYLEKLIYVSREPKQIEEIKITQHDIRMLKAELKNDGEKPIKYLSKEQLNLFETHAKHYLDPQRIKLIAHENAFEFSLIYKPQLPNGQPHMQLAHYLKMSDDKAQLDLFQQYPIALCDPERFYSILPYLRSSVLLEIFKNKMINDDAMLKILHFGLGQHNEVALKKLLDQQLNLFQHYSFDLDTIIHNIHHLMLCCGNEYGLLKGVLEYYPNYFKSYSSHQYELKQIINRIFNLKYYDLIPKLIDVALQYKIAFALSAIENKLAKCISEDKLSADQILTILRKLGKIQEPINKKKIFWGLFRLNNLSAMQEYLKDNRIEFELSFSEKYLSTHKDMIDFVTYANLPNVISSKCNYEIYLFNACKQDDQKSIQLFLSQGDLPSYFTSVSSPTKALICMWESWLFENSASKLFSEKMQDFLMKNVNKDHYIQAFKDFFNKYSPESELGLEKKNLEKVFNTILSRCRQAGLKLLDIDPKNSIFMHTVKSSNMIALKAFIKYAEESKDSYFINYNPDSTVRNPLYLALTDDRIDNEVASALLDADAYWYPYLSNGDHLITILPFHKRTIFIKQAKGFIVDARAYRSFSSIPTETLLLFCIKSRDLESIKLLLEKGADPEAPGTNASDTPFQRAYESNSPQIFKVIKDALIHKYTTNRSSVYRGSDFDRLYNIDNRFLYNALTHPEIPDSTVSVLMKSGALCDDYQPGGYHIVTKIISLTKYKIFIQHATKLDVNAKLFYDPYVPSNTILIDCIQRGDPEIVKILLSRGADPEKTGATKDDTPLYWAKESPNSEMLPLILEAIQAQKPTTTIPQGLSLFSSTQPTVPSVAPQSLSTSMNSQNKRKNPPNPDRKKESKICVSSPTMRTRQRFFSDSKAESVYAPIFDAIEKENIDELKKLLDSGVSLHSFDQPTDSPLQFACKQKIPNLKIIQMLLDKNSNPLLRDISGRLPYEYIFENQSISMSEKDKLLDLLEVRLDFSLK